MDVPVLTGVPLALTKSSSPDLREAGGSSDNEQNFSEHLGDKMGRLKSEQRQDVSGKAVAKAPGDAVDGSDERDLANASGKSDTAAEGLPPGIQGMLNRDNDGILKAVHVISERRGLDVEAALPAESGQSLPLADDGSAAILPAPIEIHFDPLNQPKESAAHLAAASLVAGGVDSKTNTPINRNASLRDEGLHKLSLSAGKAAGVINMANAAEPINLGNAVAVGKIVPTGEGLLNDDGFRLTSPAATAIAEKSALPLESTRALFNGSIAQPQSLSVGGGEKAIVSLDTPMGQPRWGQDFSQRVQWMVNQSVSGAQIRLNPQNMGPVEVRIQMQNDHLSIAFTAQSGATREAIDAALPRLRDMLSEQNVNVVDVDVSQHSFAEQREQQSSTNEGRSATADAGEEDDSIFDQPDSGQQRIYDGLFNGVA